MKRYLLLFPLLSLLFVGSLSAQRSCGSDEVLQRQLLENPGMLERMNAIEEHTRAFVQSGAAGERVAVTIPVVVHVVPG